MSNKTFDTLRFIQSIIIPISAFITGLSEIFGFELGLEIAAAVALLDGLFGAVIQGLRTAYNIKSANESVKPSEPSDSEPGGE